MSDVRVERVARAIADAPWHFGQGWQICADMARAAIEAIEADQTDSHEFKNFHRLLCERFGYPHDEKDWRRDQVSLIEWIAKRGEWQPISSYDKEAGSRVVLLDWFTYRTDPAKKRHPVRYVGAWSDEQAAWFDDDGMDLDIDPTHWLPLPEVPDAS